MSLKTGLSKLLQHSQGPMSLISHFHWGWVWIVLMLWPVTWTIYFPLVQHTWPLFIHNEWEAGSATNIMMHIHLCQSHVGSHKHTSIMITSSLFDTWGPCHLHDLTLIPAWISNQKPSNVWDEITYLFPNFNGATIDGCTYLSVIHASIKVNLC